jgi:Tol biopolymer transport system component/serine/threonine protein kinase
MNRHSDWESVRALFEAALQRPPSERAEFVRNQTGGDEAARGELESLLAAHEQAADFLAESAINPVRENESILDHEPRLTSGTRLGAFEIVEHLGSGGMGEIYRARDSRLDRFVAIKVLAGQLEMASRGRERFEREARAISKLSHPHICSLHDVGVARVDGREISFLVLELLDGETLAATLARGALSMTTALTYGIDIADALAAAHAQGIVHRDLKPSNVMVTTSGVKLLDFGLAQLRVPEAADDLTAATDDISLTSVGMVFGTAPYMSPEQVEGRKVDARSDVFSFGSLLYEMLTGQRAFAGNADRSTAAQILSDDPKPVNELAGSVSAELAKIVSHCLRKDRARRYQHIADVRVALEDAREASAHKPEGRTSRVTAVWKWAAALLVVTAILASVYLAWQRRIAPEAPPPRVVQLTTLQGSEASPTLAPDGDHVAFTWSGPNQDNDDIYVQRIGSGTEVRRTAHPARDFSPSWSPDGRWIAFLRGDAPGRSELILMPPLAGAERPLAEIHLSQDYIFPPYLSWFPDSSALVIVDSPGPHKPEALVVVSVENGEKRGLTSVWPSEYNDIEPSVSPDGRMVVFKRGRALHVLSVGPNFSASAKPRALAGTDILAHTPAWTPDGNEIIYSAGGSLWRINASSGRFPTRLPFAGQDAFMPALSRSTSGKAARLVYVRSMSDANIYRLDLPALGAPTTSSPVLSIASTRLDANPQFSPDGTRVAFQSTRSGSIEIWVADPHGTNAAPLTTMAASTTGTPRWSPDGKTIAFDSNADGQYDIYVVPTTGGRTTRMTIDPADDHVPSFSRDGKSLYFSSSRSGEVEIWKLPLSGGEPKQITQNGGFVGFESFDGRDLYYTQTASGSSPLWRIATAGGEPHKVLDDVSERAFVVLEKGIYYVERHASHTWLWGLFTGLGFLKSNEHSRLRYFDFASERSRVIADLGDRIAIGLGVSPDGRTVLFTRVDNLSSDLMMVENFR